MSKNYGAKAKILAERDGGWFCHYCYAPVLPYDPSKGIEWLKPGQKPDPNYQNGHDLATVDHKTCREHGGKHNTDNLVLCCHRCNCRKNKHRTYEEYHAMTAPLRASIEALEALS